MTPLWSSKTLRQKTQSNHRICSNILTNDVSNITAGQNKGFRSRQWDQIVLYCLSQSHVCAHSLSQCLQPLKLTVNSSSRLSRIHPHNPLSDKYQCRLSVRCSFPDPCLIYFCFPQLLHEEWRRIIFGVLLFFVFCILTNAMQMEIYSTLKCISPWMWSSVLSTRRSGGMLKTGWKGVSCGGSSGVDPF